MFVIENIFVLLHPFVLSNRFPEASNEIESEPCYTYDLTIILVFWEITTRIKPSGLCRSKGIFPLMKPLIKREE